MQVKVEPCWGGGERFYFRLNWNSHRETVSGDKWNRKVASEALDVLELHGINRRNVRFVH